MKAELCDKIERNAKKIESGVKEENFLFEEYSTKKGKRKDAATSCLGITRVNNKNFGHNNRRKSGKKGLTL